MDSDKMNKGLEVAQNACGLVAIAAWAGVSVYWAGTMIKGLWEEHKEKKRAEQYNKGFDDAKALYSRNDELKKQNKELLDEAMARTEGAT